MKKKVRERKRVVRRRALRVRLTKRERGGIKQRENRGEREWSERDKSERKRKRLSYQHIPYHSLVGLAISTYRSMSRLSNPLF